MISRCSEYGCPHGIPLTEAEAERYARATGTSRPTAAEPALNLTFAQLKDGEVFLPDLKHGLRGDWLTHIRTQHEFSFPPKEIAPVRCMGHACLLIRVWAGA